MALPTDADVIVVHGYWIDEITGQGVKNPSNNPATITFDPVPLTGASATITPNLRDATFSAFLKTRQKVATLDATTGYFAALLVASNDPDLDAYGGRRVTMLGEAPFVIEVPHNATTVTVDAKMATATGLAQGDTVKAIWLVDAALITTPAPTPTNSYLTSEQTLSAIADAIETGGGGGGLTIRSVSASTTAVAGEFLKVNASGGARTVTPPSSPSAGTTVILVKSDSTSNAVVWSGTTSGDTEGVSLTSQWSSATVVYDGSQWLLTSAWAVSGEDTTAPSTPTGLSAAPGDTQVALTWTASTDNVAVTKYRVRRGGSVIAEPTTNSYTDTGRTNGTLYSYTISAVDAADNESAQTSAVTATPVDTTAPSTPTGLSATPGSTQVVLSWSASTDNTAVTGYKVRRGGSVIATPSTTSYTDTGLTNGTLYSYTVSAVDAATNESAQTSAVTATPIAVVSPSDFSGLNVWYKADAITGASDDATVGAWPDSSSNGFDTNQPTSGDRPVYKTNIVNGKPVLRFTGAQVLLSAAPAVLPATTVFAVLRPTGTNGDTVRAGGDAGNLQARLDSGKVTLINQGISVIGAGATTVSTSVFSVCAWTFTNATSWAVYLNGASDGGGSTSVTLTSADTGSFIGSRSSFVEALQGDLAEVIVYDRVLNSTERGQVTAYLGAKYGITVS